VLALGSLPVRGAVVGVDDVDADGAAASRGGGGDLLLGAGAAVAAAGSFRGRTLHSWLRGPKVRCELAPAQGGVGAGPSGVRNGEEHNVKQLRRGAREGVDTGLLLLLLWRGAHGRRGVFRECR